MDESDVPLLSLGDIMDKLSILTRKIYFGEEDAISEHRYLEKVLGHYGVEGKLVTNVIRLTQMNIEIWNRENKMRRDSRTLEQLSQEELAEYGRKALEIRDLNRKRIEYKNYINELMKAGFREVKVNHQSGGTHG